MRCYFDEFFMITEEFANPTGCGHKIAPCCQWCDFTSFSSFHLFSHYRLFFKVVVRSASPAPRQQGGTSVLMTAKLKSALKKGPQHKKVHFHPRSHNSMISFLTNLYSLLKSILLNSHSFSLHSFHTPGGIAGFKRPFAREEYQKDILGRLKGLHRPP